VRKEADGQERPPNPSPNRVGKRLSAVPRLGALWGGLHWEIDRNIVQMGDMTLGELKKITLRQASIKGKEKGEILRQSKRSAGALATLKGKRPRKRNHLLPGGGGEETIRKNERGRAGKTLSPRKKTLHPLVKMLHQFPLKLDLISTF